MSAVLVLASFVGIVTFFVPFAYDTSALSAMQNVDLWRLAVPFLVPFVAVFARTVEMQRGELSAGTRRFVYVWSVVTLMVTLSLYVPGQTSGLPAGTHDWIGFFIPLAVIAFTTFVFARSRNVAAMDSARPMLALRLAYLPNAFFCLFAFLPRQANIGAYLAVFTALAYAADVVRRLR